ncbi:MAG TPA: alpha/beta hydrolase-fold protein [Planosporangium sp.]|nr:alpha/beta hydrolase-fold protein [Planosporangium sp.]
MVRAAVTAWRRALGAAVAGLLVIGLGGCATDASAARFVAPSASARPRPTVANAEPWLLEARRNSEPGKGVWTSMTLPGRRTGYQLPAWVYVPDEYFDPEQPDRRFPVVLLLAGFPGAIENWDKQGHVLPILDQMMAEKRIPPMILVSASQNPEPTRDSECVDAVAGAKADTYLSQDVPEAIGAHLRVTQDRNGWSMMGYSTGGYCGVALALRHSERFGSAVSLDGYFAPAIDKSTGDLFKGDAAVQRSYTPLQTIRDRRPAALRFYLVVGDAEAKARNEARTFARAVQAPDTVTVVEVPGGHNWDTWNRALPAALTWLSTG